MTCEKTVARDRPKFSTFPKNERDTALQKLAQKVCYLARSREKLWPKIKTFFLHAKAKRSDFYGSRKVTYFSKVCKQGAPVGAFLKKNLTLFVVFGTSRHCRKSLESLWILLGGQLAHSQSPFGERRETHFETGDRYCRYEFAPPPIGRSHLEEWRI